MHPKNSELEYMESNIVKIELNEKYEFQIHHDGTVVVFRNGEYHSIASNPELWAAYKICELENKVKELEGLIDGIEGCLVCLPIADGNEIAQTVYDMIQEYRKNEAS